MPARGRQDPAAEANDLEAASSLRSLKFNQPISWRIGRPTIPVGDLLQRLQDLAHELRNLEQEEINKDSLTKVSQELASGHLLAHKDRGVRAWVACCIVDVLRLCAPDAPFTANQLKDIFTCVVSSIIQALADPSHTYNAQHIYVLSSLADVKSIVLMTDLDHPDSLIASLFTSCFDIMSASPKASTGEEVAKNVEFDMTRLLVTIVDESLALSSEVVDIIVAQFLRVDPRALETSAKKSKRSTASVDTKQGTLLLKDYPPAYNMAKAICQACPERMTSHISQYFNNVIIDASGASNTNGSSKPQHRRQNLGDSDEESEDIKELSKAHRLIRELWKACPEVLQNVIPQLEAELSTESVSLRLLATQTIGDLAAGIGVAGPPPPPPMDPIAYPPVALADYAQSIPQQNPILTPLSHMPFPQAHSSAYESFLSRRLDKSASVRAAWATVVGRILLTSAGGSGLSESEERELIAGLTSVLRDADERVRVAAVDAVGTFGLSHIVHRLGPGGGVSTPGSVLSIVAERVKDRKPQVRERAMKTLARMWAVAAEEVERGNELVVPLLKDAPSKIFDAYYTNDPDIHIMIDRVLFEFLLPLNYPPVKSRLPRSDSSQSQKGESRAAGPGNELDVDRIRVRRILTLLKGLDEKAKKVFFAMQGRQMSVRDVMKIYLEACEEYNGGVLAKRDEERIKPHLTKVIDALVKPFPDAPRASTDLWKFAKLHDRRGYQLIRFAMSVSSDYRTVIKAKRELEKRTQSANNGALLETLTLLLYRCSSLIFNRSHIPAIISLTRSDENGLTGTAHEMLREISSRNPEVLEAHVLDMCKDLMSQAPGPETADDAGAEKILKACSGFAKRLPSKLPKERNFLQALVNYALHSSSPTSAKYAVSILMACAEKKEMYARDLVQRCVKWEYGSGRFLTKLASLSQLNLLAPKEADEESDMTISIAINRILLNNRSPNSDSEYKWSDSVDDETAAKEWALKIIVNRLRAKGGADDEGDFRAHAEPVYNILNKLVSSEGELSKRKDTPGTQRPRLRLLAAKSLLKLCASHRICDQLLTPSDFNLIALVAQDPIPHVRTGFIDQLKKKLVQESHLSHRWYTIPCLLAFEPSVSMRDSTQTWLRSRTTFFSQQAQAHGKKVEPLTVMESVFSRLLSLLAYHPDYPSSNADESTKSEELADFARYILFYLSAVANERNLSLIFHIAQRVKQTRDGITKSDEITTHLHTLSDLAQITIRRFADIYSQQHKFGGGPGTNILQTYPGKMGVPSSLFTSMGSREEAQEVAEKSFLPNDIDDALDRIVKSVMRTKHGLHGQPGRKRKAGVLDTSGAQGLVRKGKRGKPSGPRFAPAKRSNKDEDGWLSEEDPKKKTSPSLRRSSTRGASKRRASYADSVSSDDNKSEESDEKQGSENSESDDTDADADASNHARPTGDHDVDINFSTPSVLVRCKRRSGEGGKRPQNPIVTASPRRSSRRKSMNR